MQKYIRQSRSNTVRQCYILSEKIDPKLESAVAALLLPYPQKPDEYHERDRQKHFRGQKRYYQQVYRKAQAFVPDLTPDHWYDFWHYHADWPGRGNLCWKHRRAHIAAHCQVFKTFVRLTADYSLPYQLWIELPIGDARQDAVYFHTPNPNGDGNHFPTTLVHVEWGLPALEQYFSKVLEMSLRAGIGRSPRGDTFFIYSPLHGTSLE